MDAINGFQIRPDIGRSLEEQLASYAISMIPSQVRENMCRVTQCDHGGECVTDLTLPLGFRCNCAKEFYSYSCAYGLYVMLSWRWWYLHTRSLYVLDIQGQSKDRSIRSHKDTVTDRQTDRRMEICAGRNQIEFNNAPSLMIQLSVHSQLIQFAWMTVLSITYNNVFIHEQSCTWRYIQLQINEFYYAFETISHA